VKYRQGLQIESQNHGNHTVHPRNVFKQPSEATDKYDYIVCAHKALKLDQKVPDALRPAVGADTTIVIIQNGVGNEDPFREAFPQNTIISCVVSPESWFSNQTFSKPANGPPSPPSFLTPSHSLNRHGSAPHKSNPV